MSSGLLSGRFEAADEVPIGKRRTRLYGPASWSQDQNRTADPELGAAAEAEIVGKPNGVLETLRNICSGSGPGVAEASLAWLLSRKGVACIIVGASNRKASTFAVLSAKCLSSCARKADPCCVPWAGGGQ